MADFNEKDIDKGEVVISDGTTNANNLKVESDGSINVNSTVSAIPPIPSGATAVDDTAFGDDTGTNDQFYTITNGTTLTIQTFQAGSEEGNGGSAIEIFDAPNGNTTGIVRIMVLYTNASSTMSGVQESFVGDGTAAILLRRRRLGGGSTEMFGRWRGYEE